MTTWTATEPNKAVVLYDGGCPLCCKSIGILKKLDWRGRLSYLDARNIEHLPETPTPLVPEQLMREMHVVTPDRQKTFTGFRAFRWIAGRLPLLWPVWPLLFVPGTPRLGQRIYRWVARNRYNLVPCRDGQCAIPSKRAG
jgi:predicted DCC family thiol-disulfide oxidoreductase YuxK